MGDYLVVSCKMCPASRSPAWTSRICAFTRKDTSLTKNNEVHASCPMLTARAAVAEERERLIKIMWAVETERDLKVKSPWKLKKDIEGAMRQEPEDGE